VKALIGARLDTEDSEGVRGVNGAAASKAASGIKKERNDQDSEHVDAIDLLRLETSPGIYSNEKGQSWHLRGKISPTSQNSSPVHYYPAHQSKAGR